MIRKFIPGILFVCIIVVMASCGANPYTSEIEQLEKLKTEVGKVGEKISQTDSLKLDEINKTVFEDLREIKRLYHPDTISMEYAQLINSYKSLRKGVAKYRMVLYRLKQNVPYTLTQITNLVKDLEEQNFTEEESKRYIQTEVQAAGELINAFESYRTQTSDLIRSYDKVQPRVKEFLQKLKETEPEN